MIMHVPYCSWEIQELKSQENNVSTPYSLYIAWCIVAGIISGDLINHTEPHDHSCHQAVILPQFKGGAY